jgi:hypothetical protein
MAKGDAVAVATLTSHLRLLARKASNSAASNVEVVSGDVFFSCFF